MVRVSAQLVLLAVSCVLLLLLVAAVAKIVPTREHIGSRHAAGHVSEETRFGLSRGGSPMAPEFSHEGGGEPGLFAISMAGPRASGSLEPAPFHPPTPYHPPKPFHPPKPIQPVTPLTPLGPTPISPASIPAPSPLSPQTPAAPDPPPPPPGWDIGGGLSILVGRDRAKKVARASPPKHISVLERQSRFSKLALPPWWQRSFGGYPWWHWYWYYPAYALKLVKDEPTYCSWCRQCLAGGGGDACESCLDHCGGQPRFFSLGP
jgi:hypothetical protein